MSELVVYRDLLGERLYYHKYECDVEIVRRTGPATRSMKRASLQKELYQLVLIFTHHETKEIHYITLSPELVTTLEHIVYSTKAGFFEDYIVGLAHFVIRRRDHKTLILACFPESFKTVGGYETALVEGGLNRILYAIRVKRFLDLKMLSLTLYPLLGNQLVTEMLSQCGKAALKSAISDDASITSPMSEHVYKKKVKLLFDPETRENILRSTWKVSRTLMNGCCETLGLDFQPNTSSLKLFCHSVEEMPNEMCAPLEQWSDESLFVRGLWNLYLSSTSDSDNDGSEGD